MPSLADDRNTRLAFGMLGGNDLLVACYDLFGAYYLVLGGIYVSLSLGNDAGSVCVVGR